MFFLIFIDHPEEKPIFASGAIVQEILNLPVSGDDD
jgi:hypothetical protein